MHATERFGFLANIEELSLDGASIRQVDDFHDINTRLDSIRNVDGFIYPPQIHTVRMHGNDPTACTPVKNTSRPAAVFALPASHEIEIFDPVQPDDLRHGDAGVIVHLLALIFGSRLQFEGWKFDTKVSHRSQLSIACTPSAAQHFISWAYSVWRGLNADLRRIFVRILYMHSRSLCHEWFWDSFSNQYAVFDAIYNFDVLREQARAKTHGSRLRTMLNRYSIPTNDDVLREIVKCRNELVHEAVLDGNAPGTGRCEPNYFDRWMALINAKLIVALTGYRNDFTSNGWWSFGWQIFDKHQEQQES